MLQKKCRQLLSQYVTNWAFTFVEEAKTDMYVWMFGKVWHLKIQNKNDKNIFKVLNT